MQWQIRFPKDENSKKCKRLCWNPIRSSGILTKAHYTWQGFYKESTVNIDSLSFTGYECHGSRIIATVTTIDAHKIHFV